MINKLKHLSERIFSCNLCKRLREVTPIPYPHICFNYKNSDLVLCVGRNPGLEHDYSEVNKEEFVNVYSDRWLKSRAGKYMILNTSKEFVLNNMFWTNICKCSSPNNSQLTDDEIENCRIFLQMQIKILEPKKILTFGKEALNWFFPGKKISEVFGKELSFDKRVIVPFYHYSYLTRSGNLRLYHRQKDILRKVLNCNGSRRRRRVK